jgi:hypothetical protein
VEAGSAPLAPWARPRTRSCGGFRGGAEGLPCSESLARYSELYGPTLSSATFPFMTTAKKTSPCVANSLRSFSAPRRKPPRPVKRIYKPRLASTTFSLVNVILCAQSQSR